MKTTRRRFVQLAGGLMVQASAYGQLTLRNSSYPPLMKPPASSFSPVNALLWMAARLEIFANNDPVGTWTDQSGNGRHATQATSGRKPLFKTGIIGGKPTVRFDGTDDYLAVTEFTATDYNVFIVAQSTGDGLLIDGGNTGDTAGQFLRYGRSGSNVLSNYRLSNEPISSALSTSRGSPALFEMGFVSGTASFFENGSSVGTGTGLQSYVKGIGGLETLTTLYLNGDIAEVLICGTLTAGEKTATRNHLKGIYGL